MSIGHTTFPFVSIYKIGDNDTFTKINNPSILPASAGHGISFDSTGTYMAVSTISNLPVVHVYKITSSTDT